jgi:hypothetical protein
MSRIIVEMGTSAWEVTPTGVTDEWECTIHTIQGPQPGGVHDTQSVKLSVLDEMDEMLVDATVGV